MLGAVQRLWRGGVMAFCISRIEMLALRKLHLVSRALASKLSGTASLEQDTLAKALGDVLDRYEIEAAKTQPGGEG
jgi:hypothetical protein